MSPALAGGFLTTAPPGKSHVRLLLFSTFFLRFIHVVACISSLFLFIAEQHSIVWIEHIVFMESPVDGHLGYFHFLTIVNNAVMNIHMQGFV